MPDLPQQRRTDEPPAFAPGETHKAGKDVPALPAAPQRPLTATGSPSTPASRLVSLMIAVVGLSVLAAILLVCTIGNVAALLIAGGVFAFGAVHYLIWGWWLSRVIQQQERDRGETKQREE